MTIYGNVKFTVDRSRCEIPVDENARNAAANRNKAANAKRITATKRRFYTSLASTAARRAARIPARSHFIHFTSFLSPFIVSTTSKRVTPFAPRINSMLSMKSF